ncbi:MULTISPECIES: extracellular solute-binding protein [unclassified Mesorhizobium]|uniref:ABC transporter substrate-binding protein n=1 Tax=unclassified Mesorhizobium TaxID=325217 RepID=UPI0011287DE6|nr:MULTISPECIES: extracellular solute-binding protein [unclassified Mesorhizobium]TPK45100.1 extracellular solute-binding protein [Mesorhizobium sp. B2-5-2]TPL15993.1 extracellular solute-binding protein [Mesorhizobium sp. B2-4-9]TPL17522.1 extracellular solute-binding protein [Mesorhizobium sp. B2-4-7]TPL33864.1 extracellular solute-binding protein [Mesorhizobium sp. B2-4-5]TPM71285.1 extracellular solute-binding protein [Mesorhizobium sp. B2-1-6]
MTARELKVNRRTILGGIGGTFLAGTTRAWAQSPKLPASPVVISVMDVGGALALSQPAFENYAKKYPERTERIVFTKAPVTELAGKLRAQQEANRVDIDMVLTGSDGLAAGLANGTWIKILPDFNDKFPKIEDNYEPAALALHKKQGAGYGVVVNYYPSGPLIEYAPERVKEVPGSVEELLAWAKANPGRFIYARPTNSGPGRTFMMGLPYLLGDKDPQDPVDGWEKTWAYLAEIGQYIDYYPAGTGVTMKEFGEGSRDIIISTTGWDINPRALGIVPESARIGTLKGFHWVSDAFFMCVPKGISDDKLAVVLDLMAFLLTPEAQAYSYDEGYLYPGPAVKNVPVSMAPQHSQDIVKRFGRDEYASLIADNPIELPLPPEKMIAAFRKWDELVGAKKS